MATEWTTDKIYNRCAYLNCFNGKHSTGHKLFKFPAYSDSRHHLWIRYAGNVRLRTWASATLRRAGICAEHFDPESFVDDSHRTLRRNAVPKPYSARDGHAKLSSTLLAQIKSVPRKHMRTCVSNDADEPEAEFETRNAPPSPEAGESRSAAERTTPVETRVVKAVKTLRKVKRIKIEEQISNSSRTVILERCGNPESCPANSQSARDGEKPRPHFHKVYVKNAEKIEDLISGSHAKVCGALRCSCGSTAEQAKYLISEKCCHDTANGGPGGPWNEQAAKVNKKPIFQLQKYRINLSRAQPKKEELSTTSRYTGEPENMMSNWQAIQEARAGPALATVPEDNNKKNSSTAEFIEKYYKTKDERSFDRCAYINCKNGRFTTGAHLFRFPQIKDPRLTTWIKNAGNPRMLYWSWSTIRRAGLCADHFTKDSFFNETRQRLLRTALPKPFYLEENVTADGPGENLSPDDLLKVFNIIEKEREDGADEPATPGPIDLPSERTENREDLKIRYPFEDPELPETDNEEIPSCNVNYNDDSCESFTSVMVKNEPLYQRDDDDDDDETNETLSTTGRALIKEELIEEPDPLGDANIANDLDDDDSEEVDNIREILALEQQKARLCRVIKQFSSKLKDAKIHKNKLRSRLLAYSDLKMH